MVTASDVKTIAISQALAAQAIKDITGANRLTFGPVSLSVSNAEYERIREELYPVHSSVDQFYRGSGKVFKHSRFEFSGQAIGVSALQDLTQEDN